MKRKDSRICVIGAGAAGLSAAYYMKERGYTNITVLEAADRVGGKCRSVDYHGRSFDIGANYVTAAYSEIRKLAQKFRANLYTESATITASVSTRNNVTFSTPFAAIVRKQKYIEFACAMVRYFWIRLRLRDIIDQPGFEQISKHQDLCVSFRGWLKNNNLSALETMFEFPITIMGYGYLDEIPAPYALKYLSLATYWNLIVVSLGLPRRWPKRFVDGFERLWDAVAKQLDVRLRSDIAAIDRSGLIRVHLNNADIMEFDYLVLACPLGVDSLDRFLILSREEKDLFRRIVFNKYAVTSYALPNLRLPKRIVGMSPIPKTGYPWAITQQYADNEFVQFYTRLDDTQAAPKENAIGAIRHCVTALGTVLPKEYITYNEWNYFPHVTVNDLRNGFYDRLEALQGQSNTFYCGGVAAFELVETVVEYSRRMVETYF
jgi:hypothetical protein